MIEITSKSGLELSALLQPGDSHLVLVCTTRNHVSGQRTLLLVGKPNLVWNQSFAFSEVVNSDSLGTVYVTTTPIKNGTKHFSLLLTLDCQSYYINTELYKYF